MYLFTSRSSVFHRRPIYLGLAIVMAYIFAACVPINPEETITNLQNPSATAMAPPTTELSTVDPLGPDGAMREASIVLNGGTEIAYTIILPPGYEAGNTYPTLLALPPGSQTQSMVTSGLSSYWRDGALANGWVVVSPVAPNGQLFFQGSEQYIPEFLEVIAAEYPPEGGKFHLGGVSNGGISAFRVAGVNPDRFHSILVLPGYPMTAEDKANLAQLTTIPIAFFVGENDSSWTAPIREAVAMLNNGGGNATLTIVPDEGHFIRSLIGGEQLFQLLENFRRG